ncbi:hypothetical protein [Brevibacterium marinum]|uniref:Uncharacterized protein n=1 Tax=Brevibacterium marinum TaxID=418643 RepID=A0A846RY04_9MICO|nr:hypothetical protein [Brevibacterium marinum]NJC56315.1 hypothetical protein [Brevibacterium marinum]
MRHDAERPETTHLIADAPVPGHWTQVLAMMRADPFTCLSRAEVVAEATHILVVAPTAEVAHACFTDLLGSSDFLGSAHRLDSDVEDGSEVEDGFIEIITAEAIVPENVPAGTWIFLPHRQDGWTELEATSARVRAMLVKDNAMRAKGEKLTLIEYGVNLWLWAEPPYAGGDPVCHAGELISWESAWTLGDVSGTRSVGNGSTTCPAPGVSARPPIYFGLPTVLRERRWNE